MKKILVVLAVMLVIGAAVYLLMPSGEDVAENLDQAGAGDARVVAAVAAGEGDATFSLDADNTSIGFSCSKTLAGKTLAVHGGWSGEFGSRLDGEVIVDADTGEVRQVRVEIEVGSLWSEHDLLTDALLHKGFFQAEAHPTARFVSTSIVPASGETSALEGATHQVEGNFLLNGIEKSIAFPARIEVGEGLLKVTSSFALDRKDFNVNFTDTVGFGLLTDENISHQVAVKLMVQAGGAAPAEEDAEHEPVVKRDLAPLDESTLAASYTETIEVSQVDFDMVLVPGSPDQGIRAFYLGRYEVTWDEFMPWVACEDVEDTDEHGILRARKLRPSPPYGDITRGYGSSGYPALSMSRLSAELYCAWLSQQTGRTYRLPTEKEWEYAYTLGGGDLGQAMTAETADAVAVYAGNSEDDFTMEAATRSVGSKEANELGIHDMAGNVCEWVSTDGEERVARGGHFESEPGELGRGRHVEDPSWNLNYPNVPKSIWWFVDARWVGFRLVSDP